ncbi:hypothetical protein WT38_02725 [Burkholderia territorii]|nr:hypothetical protein WT38_02725 [Burkholderia territorii]
MKRPVFQNHAAYISQTNDGRFITKTEAHYICAILNAPIVGEFLVNSSDSRSFKIRPPINVPIFDSQNALHKKLSELSIRAHQLNGAGDEMKEIDRALNETYLELLTTDLKMDISTAN